MTSIELYNLIEEKLTPLVSAADLKEISRAIVSFFLANQAADIIPLWSSTQKFQTNGTDSGRYCKSEDNAGNVRIFETRIDNNVNNAPPASSVTRENEAWKEISSSSGSAIKEWTPGVFGPGLIIVYHNHSVDGEGLYLLSRAARPYSSVNIETEIAANEWIRLNKSLPSSVWVDQGEWNPQEDPIPFASKKNYTWDIVLTDPDNPPEIGGKMLTPGATIRSMKPGASQITDFKVYY